MKPDLDSFTDTLWFDTAQPSIETPMLDEDATCDVIVIGGGFTGLRAAVELAKKGTSVIVVEAGRLGAGASGRSGGQVNPMLPIAKPDDLRRAVGTVYFDRMAELSLASADGLLDFIRDNQIQCDARQHGWLRADHCDAAGRVARQNATAWNEYGAGFEFVDAAEVNAISGAVGYRSGVLSPRGGAIHPLSLVRGLARVAIGAGVRIFTRTRVSATTRDADGWHVETPKGSIKASQIIVATNGYTDRLVPKLRKSVLPFTSIQIATEPLAPDIIGSVLSHGHTISDTRRLIIYARREPGDRIVFGGIGYTNPNGTVGGFDWIKADAQRIFPTLKSARWSHRWYGQIALTDNRIPHLHEPAPGMIVGLGYNGRGVAMSSAMGKVMADRALGRGAGDLPFPVTAIKPYKWRGIQAYGAPIAMHLMRWHDQREANAPST